METTITSRRHPNHHRHRRRRAVARAGREPAGGPGSPSAAASPARDLPGRVSGRPPAWQGHVHLCGRRRVHWRVASGRAARHRQQIIVQDIRRDVVHGHADGTPDHRHGIVTVYFIVSHVGLRGPVDVDEFGIGRALEEEAGRGRGQGLAARNTTLEVDTSSMFDERFGGRR